MTLLKEASPREIWKGTPSSGAVDEGVKATSRAAQGPVRKGPLPESSMMAAGGGMGRSLSFLDGSSFWVSYVGVLCVRYGVCVGCRDETTYTPATAHPSQPAQPSSPRLSSPCPWRASWSRR